MADPKVIAVVGATGAQGGGLVRAILADPDGGFVARAITRNPSSESAKALAALGVEVVKADLDDAKSVEQAFAGAYGAFCVTNFWEHFSPDKELEQARNMAEAAKRAGTQHVIWSTLEDTRDWVPLNDDRMPTLNGKWKVPHYDGKAVCDPEFTGRGLPVTLLRTSFYWENMIYFGMGPKRGEDGALAITFPIGDARLPGMAAEDIGRVAYGIFKAGDELIGETVSIAGEHLSGAEMAAALSDALGEPVGYNAVAPETYRRFGFPGADDLGNMFQVVAEFEDRYAGARDLEKTRRLNPQLQSFREWLVANKDRLPLEDSAAAPAEVEPAGRPPLTTLLAGVLLLIGTIVFLWYAPSSYDIYKALHVIAIVIWVGGDVTLTTLGIVFERRRDGDALAALGKLGAWIGVHIYTPALFVAFAFGVALIEKGHLGWSIFWIDFALVGWAIAATVGVGFVGPELGRIDKAAQEFGPASAEVARRVQRLFMIFRFDTALLILIVLDMVAKPSF